MNAYAKLLVIAGLAEPGSFPARFSNDVIGRGEAYCGRLSSKQTALVERLYNEVTGAAPPPAPLPPSAHVGRVGQRLDFAATVVFSRNIDSQYGSSTLYVFRDDSGNDFKWFSSSRFELTNGARYMVRGTVKKHDEYNGRASTILTRCVAKEVKRDRPEAAATPAETHDYKEAYDAAAAAAE